MPIPSSDLVTVAADIVDITLNYAECRDANVYRDMMRIHVLADSIRCSSFLTQSDVGRTTKEGVQGSIADGQQCNEHRPQALSRAFAWAAWHPVKGFGQLPNACADIDDAIADAKCQTILDDSNEWKAVRVEIRRAQ